MAGPGRFGLGEAAGYSNEASTSTDDLQPGRATALQQRSLIVGTVVAGVDVYGYFNQSFANSLKLDETNSGPATDINGSAIMVCSEKVKGVSWSASALPGFPTGRKELTNTRGPNSARLGRRLAEEENKPRAS